MNCFSKRYEDIISINIIKNMINSSNNKIYVTPLIKTNPIYIEDTTDFILTIDNGQVIEILNNYILII